MDEYMRIEDYAKLFSISVHVVRRLCTNGSHDVVKGKRRTTVSYLPDGFVAFKIGGQWRIRRESNSRPSVN